jgi:hypothetical protein
MDNADQLVKSCEFRNGPDPINMKVKESLKCIASIKETSIKKLIISFFLIELLSTPQIQSLKEEEQEIDAAILEWTLTKSQ